VKQLTPVSYGGGAQGCRVRLGTWGGYGGGGGAALGGEGDRGSANEARETMSGTSGIRRWGSEYDQGCWGPMGSYGICPEPMDGCGYGGRRNSIGSVIGGYEWDGYRRTNITGSHHEDGAEERICVPIGTTRPWRASGGARGPRGASGRPGIRRNRRLGVRRLARRPAGSTTNRRTCRRQRRSAG
jgi:hypothetical protein